MAGGNPPSSSLGEYSSVMRIYNVVILSTTEFPAIPATITNSNSCHRYGRAKSSTPGRKPRNWSRFISPAKRAGLSLFFKEPPGCVLSCLVVTPPCHAWLSPLLVTLTGEREIEKICYQHSSLPSGWVVRPCKAIWSWVPGLWHGPVTFGPDSTGPRQCSLTT